MEGRVRFLKYVTHFLSSYIIYWYRPISLVTSIWQKITKPDQTHACDSPLALCDFRTVAPEDLVAADIIFPHYQDEAYEVTYNSNQRWFYKKKMDWDDVLLFKLGDNAPDEAPCRSILVPPIIFFRRLIIRFSMPSFGVHGPFCSKRHTWTGECGNTSDYSRLMLILIDLLIRVS